MSLYITAEYDLEPEFTFHAFVGKLGKKTLRWVGGGDAVEAFKEMASELIREGVCVGGKLEDLIVMWSSSMNDLACQGPYRYIEDGTVQVEGKTYYLTEMLVHGDKGGGER